MRRNTSWMILQAMFLMAVTGLTGAVQAQDIVINEPVVRGEVARLLRQAYDYEHRNSNRNVFRRSNHFHPTRNVFRSSRHYQQKLAASSDGYPLRTFVRFGRSVDGGPREQIEYSYATHRRSPFGLPSIEEPGYEALALRRGGHARPYQHRPYECATPRDSVSRQYQHDDVAQPIEYRLITPESAETMDAERNDVRMEARTDVVLRQIERDDGSVHTIITNGVEPTGETIDDAWQALSKGYAENAEALFRRHVMDEQRGAEAMAGYGLSQLLAGDVESAATALRRAQRIDADVLQRLLIDNELREQLTEWRNDSDVSTEDNSSNVESVQAALELILN